MADKKTFSSRAQEVIRTFHAKSKTPSMGEFDVAAHIKKNDDALAAVLKAAEMSDDEKRTLISQIVAQSSELVKLKEVLEQRRGFGAEKALRTGLRTAVGVRHTKEDISRISHSTAVYGDVVAMAGSSSYQLEQRQHQLELGIDKQRKRILEATEAETLDVRKLTGLNYQLDRMKHEQGLVTGAIAYQKHMGTDIQSKHQNAALYTRRIEEAQRREVDREIARTGQAGSVKSLQNELAEASKQLIAAFKELDEAIKTGTGDVDALSKAFDNIKDSVQSKQEQIAELKRMGGGGGRVGMLALLGEGLQAAGPMIQSGANVYRQWAIGQEMDKTRLHTGFANIANQRFQDSASAARGDMAALLRITGGSYDKAAAFAKEISDKEYKAAVASAIGAGTTATGSAILGAISGSAKGAVAGALVGSVVPFVGTGVGAVVGGIAGGLSAAASGIEQTSGQMAKIQSGAVRSEAFQEAFQAKLAQETAQQQMQAYVLQRAMDFTQQSWRATRGAGGARAGILNNIRGAGYQRDMALSYGLSQEDILGLTSAGIGALGRQFRTSDIEQAGRMSKAGLLAPEEYMGLRGQIAGAGGTARDLETILKNAVATGMDSSKNIGEMTRGIFSISARTSAGGISTFGGAAARAGAVFGVLESMGVAEAQRGGIVADIGKRYEDILNTRQIDIPSLVQSAQMFDKLGLRAGTIGAEAGAKLKPQQAQQIMAEFEAAKTDEERQKVLDKHGLRAWARDIRAGGRTVSAATIKEQADINMEKVITNVTQSFAWGKDVHAQLTAIGKRWGTASQKEREDAEAEYRSIMMGREGAPSSFEALISYGNLGMTGPQKDISTDVTSKTTGFGHTLVDPLRGKGYISSGFGRRTHPITGEKGTMHQGIDIAAPSGTDIFSVTGGKIEEVRHQFDAATGTGWGNTVAVRDAEGNLHRYSHLKDLPNLKIGQTITAGSVIGQVGQSGGATGPHLDYSVRKQTGEYIDPLDYLGKETKESQEPGFGADVARAIAGVTEYAEGLRSVNGNLNGIVESMKKNAEILKPENFKSLMDSTGNLDKSVQNLAQIINALGLQQQGKYKEAQTILNNVNAKQGR